MEENKIYRVICSQLEHSDEIFIDIAPTDANKLGVTHEMMFYSRMKLSGETLVDYGVGSVFLKENGWHDPEIDFSQGFHAPKGTLEYESYMRMCERIEPQILQTFKQMRAEGKSSTLGYIMNVPEVESYKEHLKIERNRRFNGGSRRLTDEEAFELREKRRRQSFAEKHQDLLSAPTPVQKEKQEAKSAGEERLCEERENVIAAERRRQNKLADMENLGRTEDVIEVMRRKMKMYDGD
ncbi:MAG: hypothetical protein J6N49_04800 [Alphaproteobacteria bacterium]|nr:hypothetical protein [Alphaproteobacteria bacterium]